MNDKVAYLSNQNDYTVFRFGEKRLKFRAPYSLQRYTEVKSWDNGFIVAMAKYAHNEQPIEEYIDLHPILSDLRMDAKGFLSPISNVKVCYD